MGKAKIVKINGNNIRHNQLPVVMETSLSVLHYCETPIPEA